MTLDLEALYIDLHRHPELSFQETRTAGSSRSTSPSWASSSRRASAGPASSASSATAKGPVVWLRADMDALPVAEQTGLEYASTARGTDPSGIDVPVMHACGHDMHVTALLGALERLVATKDEWSGTIVAVFQPAEEYGAGSQAMIADGVLDRFPKPDIVLGQHVTPLPAGTIGVRTRHADGGIRWPHRHPARSRRPRLAAALDDRPGRDGGGHRHAAADDRLARGRPPRRRGRHRRLDPRGPQEQHHPRRGEARAEPALPRRRGPRPRAREGRARRARRGAGIRRRGAAGDRRSTTRCRRRSTMPPRPRASPPLSTPRSARAPSSTPACSPAARTCRGSPARPAFRWCSGSGAASTRRRSPRRRPPARSSATSRPTTRPSSRRCCSRRSSRGVDALVVAAREFLDTPTD